jgi:hypothetical protein
LHEIWKEKEIRKDVQKEEKWNKHGVI